MRAQKSKGTRDLLPDEMRRFRFIEGIFRDTCLKWDYSEVRTPTIEYLHLFTSTGTLTPGTLSKVYSFLDWDGWSGERVVLRPDGTIPVARLYIDNLSKQEMARLFYVTNIFIFEETGEETREKWQCGAELIGAGLPSSDVELITVAMETLQKIGMKKVELKLSHAGLIRALLAGFGLSTEEQGEVFDQILDGDVAVLGRLRARTPELVRLLTPLLELKGESSGFLKNLKVLFDHRLSEFAPALDNFTGIADLLTAIGQKYEIDIGSGRGFEYYTGVIFQLFIDGIKVGGGGRYDALIPQMGGKNVPASGFALYLDPLMSLVRPPGAVPERIIVSVSDGKKTALDIVRRLHDAGFIAVAGPGTDNKSLTWKLTAREDAPRFRLTDRTGKIKCDFITLDEALQWLGGKRER